MMALSALVLGSFYLEPEGPPTWPVRVEEARLEPQPFVLPSAYRGTVLYWTDWTGVPVWIACRLFSVESTASGDPMDPHWNPLAVSPMGAQGMAQLMPSNLERFRPLNGGKPIDPFDPETAIRVGLGHLAYLRSVAGSWGLALRMYNGGLNPWLHPGRYRWKQETLDYEHKILGEESRAARRAEYAALLATIGGSAE